MMLQFHPWICPVWVNLVADLHCLSRYTVAISIVLWKATLLYSYFFSYYYYSPSTPGVFFMNGGTVLPANQDITGGVLGGVILHVTAWLVLVIVMV